MIFDKNLHGFLQIREHFLDPSGLEMEYEIVLPPICKAYISVFYPYFKWHKALKGENEKFDSFLVPFYSRNSTENPTIDEDEFAFEERSFALEMKVASDITFNLPLEAVYLNYGECRLGLSHFNSIQDIDRMLEDGLSKEENFVIHKLLPIALIETHSPSEIYISIQPSRLETFWMDKLNAKGCVQIFPKLGGLVESLETVPNSNQLKH